MVEWNGRSLQGCSNEGVYEIICESRNDPQVELIVHRSLHRYDDVHRLVVVVVLSNGCYATCATGLIDIDEDAFAPCRHGRVVACPAAVPARPGSIPSRGTWVLAHAKRASRFLE